MTERLTLTWKRGDELKPRTSCGKGNSVALDKYTHVVADAGEREWQTLQFQHRHIISKCVESCSLNNSLLTGYGDGFVRTT